MAGTKYPAGTHYARGRRIFMRRKIIAAIMSVIVCSAAVLPANASAEKRPDIGAWSSFLPGWFNDDDFVGFDDDNGFSLDDEDSQGDNYWYDVW